MVFNPYFLNTLPSSEEVQQHHMILGAPPLSNTNCNSKIGNLFERY